MFDLFSRGNKWFRASEYMFIPSPKKNILLIVPTPNSSLEWYNPMSYLNSNPDKQTNKPNVKYSPHIHLANIDLNDENQILEFVNKWGLLGLWEVSNYKYMTLTEAGIFVNKPPENQQKKVFDEGLKYSICYQWKNYKNNDSIPYRKSFCEPLRVFKKAAKKYQILVEKIKNINDNPNLIFETTTSFNLNNINPTPYYNKRKKEWDFGWEYSTLYHAIYLLKYLDLVKGYNYKECKNEYCNNIFIPTNNINFYCSERCKQNQETRDHRKRKARAKELWQQNYSYQKAFKIINKEFNKNTQWPTIKKWFEQWTKKEK